MERTVTMEKRVVFLTMRVGQEGQEAVAAKHAVRESQEGPIGRART